MMKGPVLVLGALAFSIAGSCSDGRVAGTSSTLTDSAGIAIVFTQIGDDAPTCRIGAETLRIGSADGDDATMLFAVNGAAMLADGRIAVVNRGTAQIKVFSATGALVSQFGRQGEGPAEFRNLWSVYVREPDTLVVGDYRPWRFSFFSPDGELLRRVELRPPMIERPDFAMPLAAGFGFVMEDPSFEVQNEMVDRVVPLRLYGEDGELVGEVGSFWLDQFGFLAEEIRYVGRPIFGARASFSHLRDDLILYGTGRHEQFEFWSAAGELQRIVRWESRERTVAPGDADVWRQQRRAEMEARFEITPDMEPIINAQVGEHLPVAAAYPGHDQLLVAGDDHIWVQEYRRPVDQGPDKWWIFAPDGQFVCVANVPEGLQVLAVGRDRLVGLLRDSLDVEYILGYPIEYSAGRQSRSH